MHPLILLLLMINLVLYNIKLILHFVGLKIYLQVEVLHLLNNKFGFLIIGNHCSLFHTFTISGH